MVRMMTDASFGTLCCGPSPLQCFTVGIARKWGAPPSTVARSDPTSLSPNVWQSSDRHERAADEHERASTPAPMARTGWCAATIQWTRSS